MFSSLILDHSKTAAIWIVIEILSKKGKPRDTNLESTMFNLADDRVTLKLNNSDLVKKVLLHCVITSFQIYS